MPTRDPKAKLTAALDTLETYTKENNPKPIQNASSIRQMIGFAQTLVSVDRIKPHTVIRAIEDVKRYHPIINGSISEESQKLSERALDSIHRFNQLSKTPTKWFQKLFRFFFKKKKIKKTIHLNTPSQHKKAEQVSIVVAQALLKQEEDAFRMKAISLIRKKGILFPSIEDALKAIRETPIYTTTPISASSILMLSQTLTPFPGETVILKGSFKRTPKGPLPSTPISDSFELSTKSVQTGFPYPSQHTGWALADALIPMHPHRVEELPQLNELFIKKEEISNAFSDQKPLKKHAHALIQSKEKAVQEQSKEFFNLHRQLFCSILTAAPKHLVSSNASSSVTAFYNWISKHPSPYRECSQWWYQFNQLYLTTPFEALQEAWIEQKNLKLLSEDPERSFSTAKHILHDALMKQAPPDNTPQPVKELFLCMKPIIGLSAQNLFLQYTSEIIEFTPPQLSDFEKTLQSLALTQLEEYIKELESPLSKHPLQTMQDVLNNEIECINSKERHHLLVDKLEHYYLMVASTL